VSRLILGPTQPLSNGYRGSSPDVKRPGRKVDCSPPCRAEVKNAWSYTPTPSYAFMIKHRDNFINVYNVFIYVIIIIILIIVIIM
jgi:hypothetical protein